MNHGMKSKTIVAILRKKVNAWLSSIEDKQVRELAEKNTIVTGGSISSMLIDEEVNDFDIYFKNYETTLAVTNYYVNKFTKNRQMRPNQSIPVPIEVNEWVDSKGVKRIEIFIKSAGVESVVDENVTQPYQYFEGAQDHDAGLYLDEVFETSKIEDDTKSRKNQPKDYDPVFLSSNAISLKGKIQIITRFYGLPEEIHKNYDFVHCTNYWESSNSKLTLNQLALESLMSKNLVYQGSLYPLCSIFRIRKFVERGWRINVGQILKMCLQVNELNLKDFEVMKDQLTGVDVSYFTEVLRLLNERNPERIDSAYLVEILDRMF